MSIEFPLTVLSILAITLLAMLVVFPKHRKYIGIFGVPIWIAQLACHYIYWTH